jgi:hypothetical protein
MPALACSLADKLTCSRGPSSTPVMLYQHSAVPSRRSGSGDERGDERVVVGMGDRLRFSEEFSDPVKLLQVAEQMGLEGVERLLPIALGRAPTGSRSRPRFGVRPTPTGASNSASGPRLRPSRSGISTLGVSMADRWLRWPLPRHAHGESHVRSATSGSR